MGNTNAHSNRPAGGRPIDRPTANRPMSRRSFVALAGIAGATLGLGMTGCSSSTEAVLQTERTLRELNAMTPTERLNADVEHIINGMTLEQKVAQLFVVRPEPVFGGTALTAAGASAADAYRKRPVAGFCLFGPNLIDPDQTHDFLEELSDLSTREMGVAPFLSIDEEGGLVARVANTEAFGVTNVGDACDLGATGDAHEAEKAAEYMASYLKPLGFNLDFAPVCDIGSGTGEGTMDQRAFASDAATVSAMAVAQINALQGMGIMACAKHFPGIGAAQGDSHNGVVHVDSTLDELRTRELLPFAAAIEADVACIMVGHLSLPKVLAGEGNPHLPVSLSRTVITGLLREEMGYDGVVLTDALEMGAVIESALGEDPALLAIEAGCDLALIPADFEASYASVLSAAQSGRLTEARIDESLRRTLRLRLQSQGLALYA